MNTMAPRGTKQITSLRRIVLMGLVFVLLMLDLSCGHIQIVNHSTGAEGLECDKTTFLASYILTKGSGLFLSVFLLSFIILFIAIKGKVGRNQNLDTTFRPSLIFLKVAEFISKLFNPILEALRQGILRSQIYNNFTVVARWQRVHAINLLTNLFEKA